MTLEPDIDLRHAAADHAAGDLPPAEAAAFARLLVDDPALQREVASWSAFQSRLATGVPDAAHAPGPEFARELLRRRHDRAQRAIAIPMPRWFAAAAAAGLGVLIGAFAVPHARAPADAGVVALQDDGTGASAPAAATRPPVRLASTDRVRTSGDDPARLAATGEHPWIGLWTRLVTLDEGTTHARHAHLVVRMVSGSPASAAGIHAGDVILSVDGVAADQEQSLARALAAHRPGEILAIECWCAINEHTNQHRVTVGKVYE